MAALEVVKSRLEAVGLGEFILPLQAERSTREQVIKSIRDRLEIEDVKEIANYDTKVAQFRQTRSELASYIDTISASCGQSGLKVYDILGKCIATNHLFDNLPSALRQPRIADATNLNGLTRELICHSAKSLEEAWRETEKQSSSWRDLGVESVDKFFVERLTELAANTAAAFDEAWNARLALGAVSLDASLASKDLTGIQYPLDALAPLSSGIDASLIARVHRSNNGAAVVTFLETCQSGHSLRNGLANALLDPDDGQLVGRLERIASSCRDNGIDGLDSAKWDERTSSHARAIELDVELYEALKPFIEVFPEAASVPIEALRRAREIVHAADRSTLALRSVATAEPSAPMLIVELTRAGYELRESKGRIEEVLAADTELSTSEIANHVASLRGGGIFGWLKPSYRLAKRRYVTHSRRNSFSSQEAAQDLHSLAEWKKAEQKFLQDLQARTLFGLHFRGLDTDFEKFATLLRYYEKVDEVFPGVGHRELRKLLKVGDLDLLHSIPAIPNGTVAGTWAQLDAAIRERVQGLERYAAATNELRPLISVLAQPAEVAVNRLPELILELKKLTDLRDGLDHHAEVSLVLGERFSGWRTKPSEFTADLAAIKVISDNPQYASQLLAWMQEGRILEALSTVRSALEAEQAAMQMLDELSMQAKLPFNDRLRDKAQSKIAESLRSASVDVTGIYAHAAYAAAYSDLEQMKFGWIADALKEFEGIARWSRFHSRGGHLSSNGDAAF